MPTVEAPSTIAFASVTATLFAPLLLRLTAPMKLFAALVSVIDPAPAFTVTAPAAAACVIAPVCVSAPFDWIASVPLPTFTVPSASAFVSRSDTLFAPLLVSDTGPVKSLPGIGERDGRPAGREARRARPRRLHDRARSG